MSGPFQDKRILLGVSGSIAAYKAVDLASKLAQAGALVDVLMTTAATQFVTPITFRSVTHRVVLTDLFDLQTPEAIEHISLAKNAGALIVAPATANAIAKLALGLADDPISVVALATKAPLIVAPAMDGGMWEHPAVQQNVETLKSRGARFVGPDAGHLASGLEGTGRLASTANLLGALAVSLGAEGDLAGRTIVVSAGGTQEPIDPVRVVTNRSSGKMGYAIAEAARDRGAKVVLVAAPTGLDDPYGIDTRHVDTAAGMRDAVLDACRSADALIMSAAVADYTPSKPAQHKVKKESTDTLAIEMTKTDDILSSVEGNLVKVGFAAESTKLIEHARAKLDSKGADFVVANDITVSGSGFGSDANKVTIVDRNGNTDLPLMPKYDVATHILDRVVEKLLSNR